MRRKALIAYGECAESGAAEMIAAAMILGKQSKCSCVVLTVTSWCPSTAPMSVSARAGAIGGSIRRSSMSMGSPAATM